MSATQAISLPFLTYAGVFRFRPCMAGEFIGKAPKLKIDFSKAAGLSKSDLKSHAPKAAIACLARIAGGCQFYEPQQVLCFQTGELLCKTCMTLCGPKARDDSYSEPLNSDRNAPTPEISGALVKTAGRVSAAVRALPLRRQPVVPDLVPVPNDQRLLAARAPGGVAGLMAHVAGIDVPQAFLDRDVAGSHQRGRWRGRHGSGIG